MTATEKKSDLTRQRILQAAFDEIHLHGYQGMRVDAILDKAGLTKGALYHHFPNKLSLGYAVVDEFLQARFSAVADFLAGEADPLDAMCTALRRVCSEVSEDDILRGCPVNNLAQEMAGLDEGFQLRLQAIYQHKIDTLCATLRRGQASGIVRTDVDAERAARFVVSAFQGINGMGKCLGERSTLEQLTEELCAYIQSLRAV